MSRRCMMVCGDKGDALNSFSRKVLSDAAQRFPDATLEGMHHIGFLDMAKFGRLSMPEIDNFANWSLKILQLNPDRSALASFLFFFDFFFKYVLLY